MTSDHVAGILEEVCSERGLPKTIRVDNGPEFISKSLDCWAYWNGVKLDFSRPGKPTDNAYIESFNGRLRQECLNEHWFTSLQDAAKILETWWRDYNENRPTAAWAIFPRPSSPLRLQPPGYALQLKPETRFSNIPTGTKTGARSALETLT